MTKRGKIILLVVAIILTVLLEVLTWDLMNYNTVFAIISSFFYCINIGFVEADLYFTVKKKEKRYNFFLMLAGISVLGFQLTTYYLFGNIKSISSLEIIIAILLAAIWGYLWFRFFKLSQKYIKFVFPKELND